MASTFIHSPSPAALAVERAERMLPLDGGRLWIDEEFREALEHAGLTTFDAVMRTTAGRLLRALPHRENWRLDLPDVGSGPRGAYLKKHHTRSWRHWLRAKLRWRPVPSPGRVEAHNVARLERDGIAAMRLIAFGERVHHDGHCESFLLTDELAGYTQLNDFLRQRFPPLNAEPRRDRHFDRLLRDVAAVARRFHRRGYNHRDLYCCHFFIREDAPGRFRVNLIDLQRVEHRQRFRWRWLVKDLAQLNYSAPRDRISCTQRLAFMKHYLGVRKLGVEHKRLIRRVLAKHAQMERHLGAHP